MARTAPFRMLKIDLVRKACREDPAFGLAPAAKLDRIALLACWAVSLLSQKAAWRGVTRDELLREQAMRAHRRRPGPPTDA
jgi:hypothetical protein